MEQCVIVKLRFLENNPMEGDIFLSHGLYTYWNLSTPSIVVQFGHQKTTAKVIETPGEEYEISLSPTFREKLGMPFPTSLCARMLPGILRLGPVVGILTTDIAIQNHQLYYRGKSGSFFEDLLSSLNSKNILCYLFTLDDIDGPTKTVLGSFRQEEPGGHHAWKKGKVPFPDVIYNKILVRSEEEREAFLTLRESLESSTHAKMFNSGFFNKRDIHCFLQDDPQLRQYMPETHLSPNLKVIRDLLSRYRSVFLKPQKGSAGSGIFKISHNPKCGYQCEYRVGSKNVLQDFTDWQKLMQRLSAINLSNYIVQQGISLPKLNGRFIDFRVDLNKDGKNNWVITAMVARIAAKGSIITNIPAGVEVISSRKALHRVFGHRAAVVENNMMFAAVKLAARIEAFCDPYLGELTIDVGIDQNAQIWMFEANAKAGRGTFTHPSLELANRKYIQRLSDYSRFLSDFH